MRANAGATTDLVLGSVADQPLCVCERHIRGRGAVAHVICCANHDACQPPAADKCESAHQTATCRIEVSGSQCSDRRNSPMISTRSFIHTPTQLQKDKHTTSQ